MLPPRVHSSVLHIWHAESMNSLPCCEAKVHKSHIRLCARVYASWVISQGGERQAKEAGRYAASSATRSLQSGSAGRRHFQSLSLSRQRCSSSSSRVTQKLCSVKGSRSGRAGPETSVVHQRNFCFSTRGKLEDHHSVERKKEKHFWDNRHEHWAPPH